MSSPSSRQREGARAVKERPSTDTTPPGAGGRASPSSTPLRQEDHPDPGKFCEQKEGLKTRRFEIAHPDDAQWYVDQCGLVISWFRELFERVRGGDERSAGEARFAMGNLLFAGVKKLTALALDEGNRSAQWARSVLVGIDVWIDKHREKFGKGYEEERRGLSVVQRNDLWLPDNPLHQALHREVWLTQFYRREIAWPEAQRYLPEIELGVVPEEYRPFMVLAPLTKESLSEWEPGLWQLVKGHNPGLRSVLAKRYKRVEGHWSKYRKEFRRHLQRIVEAA